MGVEKKTLQEGNGTDRPSKGDTVTIEYTGNLYDPAQEANHCRGNQSVCIHTSNLPPAQVKPSPSD